MSVPNEVWITLAYVTGGLITGISACLFCAFMGRTVVGWIAEAFGG